MKEELLKELQVPFNSIGVTGESLIKAIEIMENQGYARPAINQSTGETKVAYFLPYEGDNKNFVISFVKKFHRELWPSAGGERPTASQMLKMEH